MSTTGTILNEQLWSHYIYSRDEGRTKEIYRLGIGGTLSDFLLQVLGIISTSGCPGEREGRTTNCRGNGGLEGSRRVAVGIGETPDIHYLSKRRYVKPK